MFEEREFTASNFWRSFDDEVFQGRGDVGYERTCLWVLFIWTFREHLNPEPIPLHHGESDHEIQRWWTRALRLLSSFFGIPVPDFIGDVYDSDVAGDVSTLWQVIRTALRVCDNMSIRSRDEVAELFDYRFIRIAERTIGMPILLSHFSACLVNAVAEPNAIFVDMFSSTGELFVTSGGERWRRSDANDPRYFVYQVERLDVELRMRLVLHGKNPSSYQELHPRLSPSEASRVVLRIDPPSRKVKVTGNSFGQFISGHSAVTSLNRMRDWIDPYLAVVIVNGSETEGSRAMLVETRSRLIVEGRLLAVIDFPTLPNVRSQRSAWVVDGRNMSDRRTTLMVDLSGLGTVKSQHDASSFAEFAGRLVRIFHDQRISTRWATSSHEDSTANSRHTFDREFRKGYRDVPGLCKAVSIDEVRGRGYSLRAANYVQQTDRIGGLSEIPADPLINLLMSAGWGGRTVYLIGNNGEGKSLLLRNVAQAFSKEGRFTIGISCSASDRFPLPKEHADGFHSFKYQGTRTSDSGADHHRVASDICQRFLLIHRSREHLRIFSELLGLLDFDAKRYIMPLGVSSSSISRARLLEKTIALTDDAGANQTAIQAISTKNYQIALMRSESRGGITPYLHLSSGEQQIVGLVVKVLANAEQGCLMLIDEPEISLHVSWQRVLPSVLSRVARAFDCDILVATHSPLIIASAHEDSSYCFAARQKNLVRLRPDDRRSVEGVLFKGFETYTFNNRMVHERCAAIVADAVRLFNRPVLSQEPLRLMLNELVEMRRTVKRGSSNPADDSVNRSLDLISKAREAIQKLEAMRPESAGGTPRGYE